MHYDSRNTEPNETSRKKAMLLWFVALMTLAGGAWLLLVRVGGGSSGQVLVIVAWVMLVLAMLVSSRASSLRRKRYRERFPSLETLKNHVDAEKLREVRDSEGEIAATRHLRRQVPEVPLSDAVKLIRSL